MNQISQKAKSEIQQMIQEDDCKGPLVFFIGIAGIIFSLVAAAFII